MFNIFKRKKEKKSVSSDDLKKMIEPYKRKAWIPKVIEEVSDRSSSKFSGIPVLKENEIWPNCRFCNLPMQLFLQLSSDDLPEEADKPFGEGFLQVFYCTNTYKKCEAECKAFFPFSKSTLIRLLKFGQPLDKNEIINPVKKAFPEKKIIGWEEKDDYPNWEELEQSGCSLSDEQLDGLDELGYPLPKDKLSGWPYWIQGVEYPNCPECGNRMDFIFQIDSEDNLPYMFGDAGCSHIFQCKTHNDKIAIAWACC